MIEWPICEVGRHSSLMGSPAVSAIVSHLESSPVRALVSAIVSARVQPKTASATSSLFALIPEDEVLRGLWERLGGALLLEEVRQVVRQPAGTGGGRPGALPATRHGGHSGEDTGGHGRRSCCAAPGATDEIYICQLEKTFASFYLT